MAKLFSAVDAAKIQKSVQKSKQVLKPPKSTNTKSIANELNAISQSVIEYFQGSEAILITSKDQLHDYVTKVLEAGIAGIDTETTGVDRVQDWVVGASLYYPGGKECYIPMKHIVPIFDTPYRGQLSYEEVREEFQRIVDSDTKLVFANADFDLAMIYKDIKADLKDRCWYDVQIAWRCLKENEPHNGLKELYAKYVLKGKGDPKKFSDFFPPKLFPYCKPEVAKLYAANDAKITLELCFWQLPFITKDNPKCQKNHLERIADLIWNVEFPLIKVCHVMHRTGMYLDNETAKVLMARYQGRLDQAMAELRDMVQEVINNAEYVPGNKPFLSGKDFNPKSPQHVKYLVYKLLKVPVGRDGESTDKEILAGINLPVTNQILKVRSLEVLINTFVKKLPNATTPDSRIHGQFKQIGARCVVGDTLVPTNYGLCTIASICGYPEESSIQVPLTNKHIQVLDRLHNWMPVEYGVMYENQLTIKITLSNGLSLEGTQDHPIWVGENCIDGDWITLSDIHVGDTVLNVYTPYSDGILDESNMEEVISEVVDIKYGVNTVYDIHVPNSHSFVSNGFISHNTGRFSSKEPNLQNIPSHATDIRHLFRATAADTANIDCEEVPDSEELRVQIPNWNKVYLQDGSTINAIDVEPGQIIKVYKDRKETWMQVNCIHTCSNDVGVQDIVLGVPNYGGGQQ